MQRDDIESSPSPFNKTLVSAAYYKLNIFCSLRHSSGSKCFVRQIHYNDALSEFINTPIGLQSAAINAFFIIDRAIYYIIHDAKNWRVVNLQSGQVLLTLDDSYDFQLQDNVAILQNRFLAYSSLKSPGIIIHDLDSLTSAMLKLPSEAHNLSSPIAFDNSISVFCYLGLDLVMFTWSLDFSGLGFKRTFNTSTIIFDDPAPTKYSIFPCSSRALLYSPYSSLVHYVDLSRETLKMTLRCPRKITGVIPVENDLLLQYRSSRSTYGTIQFSTVMITEVLLPSSYKFIK